MIAIHNPILRTRITILFWVRNSVFGIGGHGDLGFKAEFPKFSGTLQAEGFNDWLREVERIFEYKEVSDRMKVKLVAIKLKGHTSAWWEQLKRSRDRQGKPKICDWEKMKKKMKGHFLPFRYTQTLFQ
jgi:hypothetical protein